VIEIVDSRANLESLWAQIEPHMRGGLVTLENVEVHLYRATGHDASRRWAAQLLLPGPCQ